jgi:lipopolysaccharide/colanic/teichoic acid biosynthesis glycosyltransferase
MPTSAQKLLGTDPRARAEWDREFKLKDDPRVTRVGRFLRRTSLDELPQLWNVVRGDMSLVGTRQIIDQELERYGADVDHYPLAKPDMTGLWQVSGRSI